MYIKKYIQILSILPALFLTTACSHDIPKEDTGNSQNRTVKAHISAFTVEGAESSLPGENEINDMQACLFENGILTEVYTQFTKEGSQYVLSVNKHEGHLYMLANTSNRINLQELKAQGITEEKWLESSIAATEEKMRNMDFFSGMVDLGKNNESSLQLGMERGTARFDLSIQTREKIEVKKLTLKNMVRRSFLFSKNPTAIPGDASPQDLTIEFSQALGTSAQGIAYTYEQSGSDLKAIVDILKNGKEMSIEAPLPSILKRNTVYALNLSVNPANGEAQIDIIEWENGGNHHMASESKSLKINTEESTLPGNVTVNEEKTKAILPYTSTEMTLAIDCDDELEIIPGNMPITVESLGGTTPATVGKNLFRIQKERWRIGVPEKELKLRFHRKGLNQSYPDDYLTLVLSENPTKIEGLIQYNDSYEFDFGTYVDNELGTITVPESKKLTVEYENGEDHWIKLAEKEGSNRSFRVLGGWKPNDPTANGRKQKARLVICNTDGTEKEEYTVIRRNWGLPVTYLNGIWWCKYNAMGDSKNFSDQILSSNDPAAKAGKTVFDYLRDCTPEEFFKLWKWQYQGKTTQGMQVVDNNGVAKLEGYGPSSAHINKLDATAMAPDGYELPSMENFERIWVPVSGTIWLMWDGGHNSSWGEGVNIQRRQRRRNDVIVGTVELTDLIYISMYLNSSSSPYESLVWYGSSAQWDDNGINHGHYNNMLWATYSPTDGQGWFYSGSMKGLQPSKNGAGPNDSRLLRFKKSDVEYIYE